MTKQKLKLSEFLATMDTVEQPIPVRKDDVTRLCYPLNEFFTSISTHSGDFCIDTVIYTSTILSNNSIYFFNEATNNEYIVIFDPILDIKKRDSSFIVFYYPNQIINISLRESNVKQSEIKTNFKKFI